MDHVGGLVDAALAIARERTATLALLRSALEAGDAVKALELARQVTGADDSKAPRG